MKALFVFCLLFLSAAREVLGRTTIEVPIFEGGCGLTFFFEAARGYEEARPDILVDLYGDPRIADKIRVRVLEGTYPEVTNAGLNYWALIRNGQVQPLDEYLDGPNWEGDKTWRLSFLPGSLDRFQYQGKTYGIPFLYVVFAVWYNKNMFAEHGWEPARTWDEFFALCEQIKAAGIPPLAFQGRYPGYAGAVIDNSYYHLAGRERYYQQKDLIPGSFANPEFEQALTFIQRTAQNYFQLGALGMSHTEAQLEFFTGQTAMIFCGSWLKSEMQGKIPPGFRLGAFNLPIVDAGKADPNAIFTGTGYYFVMKNSRHPEIGADFLRFMTSREMAGTFAQMRDITVAVEGVMEGRVSEDLHDLIDLTRRATTTYGAAPGEGFPEMNQPLNDVRFKVMNGEMTPAEGARALEAAALTVRTRAENPDSHHCAPRVETRAFARSAGPGCPVLALYHPGQTPRRQNSLHREPRAPALGWGALLRRTSRGPVHHLRHLALSQILHLEPQSLGRLDRDDLCGAVALQAPAAGERRVLDWPEQQPLHHVRDSALCAAPVALSRRVHFPPSARCPTLQDSLLLPQHSRRGRRYPVVDAPVQPPRRPGQRGADDPGQNLFRPGH